MRGAAVVSMLCCSLPAPAATYWVAENGADTNACAAVQGVTDPGAYKRNAHGPSGAASCLAPGDTLHFKGTVTGVQLPAGAIVNGASGTAQTVVEGDGVGATTLVLAPSAIVLADPRDVVFRKLTLDGNEDAHDSNASCIVVTGTGGDVLFEDLSIHHCSGNGLSVGALISRVTLRRVEAAFNGDLSTCATASGVSIGGDDALVEYSWFHHNPRCTMPVQGAGISLYTSSAMSDGRVDRPVVRYSVIENNNAGVIIDGDDAVIHGNVIARNGLGSLAGTALAIGYSPSLRAKVVGNTIAGNGGVAVSLGPYGSADHAFLANNLVVDNALAIRVEPMHTDAGSVTQLTNKTTGTLSDCTLAADDFRLKVQADCIDRGTAVPGFEQEGVPDLGAFETLELASGEVRGNEAVLRFSAGRGRTLSPGLPSAWVLNQERKVTAAEADADGGVRLTFDGPACAGEEWTVIYLDTTGTAADGPAIGGPQYGARGSQRLWSFGPVPLDNTCDAGGGGTALRKSPLGCSAAPWSGGAWVLLTLLGIRAGTGTPRRGRERGCGG